MHDSKKLDYLQDDGLFSVLSLKQAWIKYLTVAYKNNAK